MIKPAHSTIAIIDRLAEITRHHDKQILEYSMLSTLEELFPGHFIALYAIHRDEDTIRFSELATVEDGEILTDNPDQTLPAAISEGMHQCINEEQAVCIKDDLHTGQWHNIYPIYDGFQQMFAVFILTGQASSAENQRLIYSLLKVYSNYLSLLAKTQRDKLTGLYNRETLDTELTSLIDQYRHGTYLQQNTSKNINNRRKKARTAYVGVIDIDYFKSINDQFGHLFGDEVLVLIARFLTEHFTRKNDLVYRYGGEEFVVIISGDSHEDAFTAFERMRCNIENHQFPQLGAVTISIGFVAINGQEVPSDIIGQADEALYFAKNNGRNQTISYNQLVASGKIKETTKILHGDAELF